LFSQKVGSMFSSRIKTLEASAYAAGSAFGCNEADFEQRWQPRNRPGKIAALVLAIGGCSVALAHHMGWTSLVASLGGWRGAA
jgi:hypothetical protein